MRKKTNRKWFWLGGICLLLSALLAYQYQQPRSAEPPDSHYKLVKNGSGFQADFTDLAQKIHQVIDQSASKENVAVVKGAEQRKEQAIKSGEGKVIWHYRSRLLTLPAGMTVESFTKLLEPELKKIGGEVLQRQNDTYQGKAVIRLDIGCRDNLEGEAISITSDQLYISGEDKAGAKTSPQGASLGELAIIIDDFGYNSEPIAEFAAIDRPLTFSVLPNRPYSALAASRGLQSGHQVMLHLPMEPLDSAQQSESQMISGNLSDSQIQALVREDISAVPGLIGINNHQGSRATGDKRVMKAVLAVVKEKHFFFVDSRTSSQSIAWETARQVGVKTGANDLFIDNESNVEYIKGQLRQAIAIAVKNGRAIVIGHARPHTAQAIKSMIPEIEARGLKLVFVSQLVQ